MVLDVGCGGGELLNSLKGYGRLFGLEPSSAGATRSQARAKVVRGRAQQLPFREGLFNILTCLDVIEHLDDDAKALENFHQILNEKGVMILTVPAFKFLWSPRDILLGHKRRYTATGLKQLLEKCGFKIIRCSYINSFYFPGLLLYSLCKKLSGSSSKPRTDILLVPKWIEGLFSFILKVEENILLHTDIPIGTSILCLVKKREKISQCYRDEQTEDSIKKNMGFFADNPVYKKHLHRLQAYKNCSAVINQTISAGMEEMLDIGNGGIINYDTSKIKDIVALDLFFDKGQAPECPNLKFKKGSALNIPFEDKRFDMVLMQNLLHYIIGKSVSESKRLLSRVLAESHRVLRPGGRLLIIESTVPAWFFLIEKMVFPLLGCLKPLNHPPVFQYTRKHIREAAETEGFSLFEDANIPKGTHVIQFGIKFPSALTPIRITKLLLSKAK